MARRLIVLLWMFSFAARAEPADLHELRWRPIGPIRGGRTKAAAGVPGKPGTFLIGVCNGGVWKTTDYGRTWQPIFDEEPTGSIGAIAISRAAPDTIYVGSGEGLQRPDLSTGDGIYKSTDGGKSWTHLGLRDGQQIPQIAVDPQNPNRLFVAVLGHPYGPNPERGIFRSLDGGKSFEKVLYKDPDTGGVDVVLDPSNSQIVYAVLWEARQAPWENGEFTGPGSGIFKSTDGGTTWKPIMQGIPTFEKDHLGRIGITVAPSRPSRLFATVETGKGDWLYRSDDAGASWAKASTNEHVVERASDFAEVKVDPKNPDIVYTASVVTWKSVDGGKTFVAWKGAPGGDDYHRLWIDPDRPEVILLAADQGAAITVNGGQTWSSWYNQPSAQMFHVNADSAFPYRLCGGQQESGSACVSSRGIDGAIGFREWRPVGVEEYGYAVPDPLDPDIIYGGKITRHDRRTGQTVDMTPPKDPKIDYRVVRTQPVAFSPKDPHTLYFASNTVWKTTDGGTSWTRISPDLSRPTWAIPPVVGKYSAKVTRRGVVYALGPSPVDTATLWAGTDDGLIHVTRDGGKTWKDVTPPELPAWAKISVIEAGRFDAATAYAAVNTLRLDELRPVIFRTHDGGKTWTRIVTGIPDGATVNAVREDPFKKGLLYAATELSVYVSPDDGTSWQSLRLNLPATSIRDLIVKDDDLAIATHGRGFWILDDVTALRQMAGLAPPAEPTLFAPAVATRVRWNQNPDTPLPPDEATSPNPPEGAILDYSLSKAAGSVVLEIADGTGVVRRFASDDVAPPIADEGNIPRWWIRPAPVLGVSAGVHRFVWDLHGASPPALRTSFPIAAISGQTPRSPRGPTVLPGTYTVKLTVDGATRTAKLVVRLDPRLKVPTAALARQHALAVRLADAISRDRAALDGLTKRRADAETRGDKDAAREMGTLLGIADEDGDDDEKPAGPPQPTLQAMNGQLVRLFGRVEEADVAPSASLTARAEAALRQVGEMVARADALGKR